MKKFKLFMNYAEEEKWLHELALDGKMLVKKNIFYTFKKAAPQDLNFQIDTRTFKKDADYTDYIQFFDDMGWQHVAGSSYTTDQYFVNKDTNKDTSIFSDKVLPIKRYLNKAKYFLVVFLVALLYTIPFKFNTDAFSSGIFNIDSYFLTPGLWEKVGSDFIRAFAFELPIALIFRIIPTLVIIMTIIFASIYSIWSLKIYLQEKKDLGEE